MGCFSCCIEDDDQYKNEIKTAMFLSQHEKEDSRARLEIAAKEAEIYLSKENHDRLLDEQVEVSKKEGKRKQEDDDQSKDDIKTALTLSRFAEEDRKARQEKEEKESEIDLSKNKQEKDKPKDKGKGKQEDAGDHHKDKQLSKTHKDEEQKMHPKDYVKEAGNPPTLAPPASIPDSGKSVIEGGKSVNPQGLCCQICQGPFALHEIAKKGKYHLHCYKEHRNSICYVCKIKITEKGRKYKEHQFWKGKYCPSHEKDGTSKCCSCERLEGESTYVMLDDFRWLCKECVESSVMDPCESIPLLQEIKGFFESKALIIDKEIPLHMVEKEALNKAETYEKIDRCHATLTRGLCMSEKQIVKSIIARPTELGPGNQPTGMVTMEQEVVRECEVTGILIIYGLPRLLAGYILAHEMMHAWLRLNGYKTLKKDDPSPASNQRSKTHTVYQKEEEKNLKEELEEGLCQVLALMWLESHTFSFTEAEAAAAASSSSSRTPFAATTRKKGDAWSEFEKTFVKFCIYQIKEDESPVSGQGFKEVYEMMRSNNYSVKDTLKEIVSASKAL